MTDNELFEQVTATERIFAGRIIGVRVDSMRMPDGRAGRREIVEHPGAVAIVPFLDDETVLLVRQYRHAAGELLWEIPAGTLEPPEPPEACAAREMVEETGYRVARLEKVYEAFVAPGYCQELVHGFIATGLTPCVGHTDEDEFLRAAPIPFAEALAMIARREIRDAKTICGLLLAAQRR